MSSIFYHMNKKIDSLVNNRGVYWSLLIGTWLFIVSLAATLKFLGRGDLHFAVNLIALLALALHVGLTLTYLQQSQRDSLVLAYWNKNKAQYKTWLLSLIIVAAIMSVHSLIPGIGDDKDIYFLSVMLMQFILAIQIIIILLGPPPLIKKFFLLINILRKFISSAFKTVSFLPSVPFTPPRLSRSV